MELNIYSELYRQEKDHWWFVGRRNIIYGVLKKYVSTFQDSAFDVGSGTGFNLSLLKTFARDVDGLEPSLEAIKLLKINSAHLHVIQGYFPENSPKKLYNIVTLLDVLEHINNDNGALQKIESLLMPGGIALITVPAFLFLWTEHDTMHHHKRRYTKRELIQKITSNTSLKIEKISYFNFFLSAPIIVIRTIKKIFGIYSHNSDAFSMPSFLNAVFEKIFSSERYILNKINFPFGISIICVLRKA